MKIASESELHIISKDDLNFYILLNMRIFRILKIELDFLNESRTEILNKFRIGSDFECQ